MDGVFPHETKYQCKCCGHIEYHDGTSASFPPLTAPVFRAPLPQGSRLLYSYKRVILARNWDCISLHGFEYVHYAVVHPAFTGDLYDELVVHIVGADGSLMNNAGIKQCSLDFATKKLELGHGSAEAGPDISVSSLDESTSTH